MNIEYLKEAIKDLPDDMELVGELCGNQDDVWRVGIAKLNGNTGIYEPTETIEEGDDVNFLLEIG